MTASMWRYSLRKALVPVLFGVMLAGCSTATSAPSPQWRDLDPCALLDAEQLGRIADDPAALRTRRIDDADRLGCAYVDPFGMTRVEIGLGTTAPRSTTPAPDPQPSRSLRIHDRPATAIYERSGNCEVWVQLTDVTLALSVYPTPGKSTVALGDTSAASCDAQIPLVAAAIDRTGQA